MQQPQLLNFDKYTFRCSSLGKIMGELGKSRKEQYDDICADIAKYTDLQKKAVDKTTPTFLNRQIKIDILKQEKSELESFKNDSTPSLPATCISYLLECYVAKRNNIKKDIHSKYFDKGIACEQVGIDMLSELHDRPYGKCELPRQYNEFIEGECDILFIEDQLRLVLDMKNSWDAFTFEPRLSKEIDSDYQDQGQGYLELYNAESFILVFALMNMPQNLIDDECKRILWQYGSDMDGSVEYNKACQEFQKKCTFDHLPLRERFFEFEVNRDRNRYNEIVERIKLCRSWLNEYARKRYLYVHGFLPEGISEVVKDSGFVELREVKQNVGSLSTEGIAIVGEGGKEVIDNGSDLHGIESNITYIEEEFVEENFPHVLDTIEKETVPEDIPNDDGFGTSPFNELDAIKKRIQSIQSIDELRTYRSSVIEKYPTTAQAFVERKSQLSIPVSVPVAPIPPKEEKPKQRPKPVAAKEEVIQQPTKPETNAEDLAKIEELRSLMLTCTTLQEIQQKVSHPNATFITQHKEFCLELMKFAQTLIKK